MRVVLGFALAFIIGAVCRIVRIPSPAPQALMGSLLVVAMSLGYTTETQFISHGGEKSCK
jgi:XapX domain-containing protein